MDILQQASKSVKETNKQVVSQALTMLNAAFAFVAALAWNEAVKTFIERYFRAGSNLLSKFVYAFLVTLIVVLVSRYLQKWSRRLNPQE